MLSKPTVILGGLFIAACLFALDEMWALVAGTLMPVLAVSIPLLPAPWFRTYDAPTVGACPSDETLAAFVDGRLTERERRAVIVHVVDCAECRDVLDVASNHPASI